MTKGGNIRSNRNTSKIYVISGDSKNILIVECKQLANIFHRKNAILTDNPIRIVHIFLC